MTLVNRDRASVWHPFTQVQTGPDPIGVSRAHGAVLFDENGREIIDGISSWWVAIHGHTHPYLIERLQAQLPKLHQVIFAGLTHAPAIELAERLCAMLPEKLTKVFYSDDGSTAVEVAIKMALQYWHNAGTPRPRIAALVGDYHGDTFGAMSVGGRNVFNAAYEEHLFDCVFVPVPVGQDRALAVEMLEREAAKGDVAAFIYEPLLQGASGMRMYPPEGLNELLTVCKNRGVFAIADEVLTGFGRTGTRFASDQMAVKPDIICLSKALTAGVIPLGVTVASEEIFNGFLSEERRKLFWHGHSFTANALGCAAGLASLDLMEHPEFSENATWLGRRHAEFALELAKHTNAKMVRHMGPVLAFDVSTNDHSGYIHPLRDRLYNYCLAAGVLLRPLGNVLYTLPPNNTTDAQLDRIYQVMGDALEAVAR